MSPLRARKAVPLGKLVRVNFTLKSVVDFLRDFLPDGHVEPGRRPWSSISLGPRGFTWNSHRRTARVDLPGPFSYETGPFGTRHADDGDPDDGCRLCGGLPGDRSRHWPGCSRDPGTPPVRSLQEWDDRVDSRRRAAGERACGDGAARDGKHCRHWYDEPETPCCRCGYNGPDETPCPGEPRDGRPPVWWTDADGRRWEQTERPDGGTTTRYLPDPVTDEEALAEPCPRCGAEPDTRCRTPRGATTKPHLPRVEMARVNRTYPEPAPEPADPPPWGTPPDPTGDDRS